MQLKATLTKNDVINLFAQLAPLVVRVGEGGTLLLASPTEVAMIPGEGVRVVCDATFHWPLLGVELPIHLSALAVRIRPAVQPDSNGKSDILAFTLQVEHTGMSLLPAVFDGRVTSRLNRELQTRNIEVAWNFGKTMSHVFQLPATLLSAGPLDLKVRVGTIEITESEIVLDVDFVARMGPRTAARAARSPDTHGGGDAGSALSDPPRPAP